MTYKTLDIILLEHPIEENNLKEGDVGTIVEVYGNNEAYEVEFVNENGETKALITLNPSDIISSKNKVPVIKWNTSLDVNNTDLTSNPEKSTTEVFHYNFA